MRYGTTGQLLTVAPDRSFISGPRNSPAASLSMVDRSWSLSSAAAVLFLTARYSTADRKSSRARGENRTFNAERSRPDRPERRRDQRPRHDRARRSPPLAPAPPQPLAPAPRRATQSHTVPPVACAARPEGPYRSTSRPSPCEDDDTRPPDRPVCGSLYRSGGSKRYRRKW